MKQDVFISHASEDKDAFVAPLAKILAELGVNVWYDEFSLRVGDSLSGSIDKGLADSRYGIVVLSKAFLQKPWPEYELRGLLAKEIGRDKVILPIWHGITIEDVLKFSPPLADRLALNTTKLDTRAIAIKIIDIVRPDIRNNLRRRQLWLKMKEEGQNVKVPIDKITLGPIIHESLPDGMLVRIKLIHHIFSDILSGSLDETINLYRGDVYPGDELAVWEKISVAYLESLAFLNQERGKDISLELKRDVLSVLLGFSTGSLNEENAKTFVNLSSEDVLVIGRFYLYSAPHIPAEPDR